MTPSRWLGRWFDGYEHRVPALLKGVGVASVLALVVQVLVLHGHDPADLLTVDRFAQVVFTLVPAVVVAYGGARLDRAEIDPARYPRVLGWCLGSLALVLGFNLVIMAIFPAPTLEANLDWARGIAVTGAVAGLAVGVVEARAIERGRAAERARVHAEHVESQRQWLDYMNGLLRHEVLNTANVIDGYALLLLEEHAENETARRYTETIRQQTEKMADVIREVRVLIEATEETDHFEVVNLTETVRGALADLRSTNEAVDVDASLVDGVHVVGDDLLPRVFSNLLSNAVKHNDSDEPRIEVTMTETDETVLVSVADNGPGVSEEARKRLFERQMGSSHGLGLYLVATLVERYGGTVELTETGPEGSVFTVELPRVSAETAAVRDDTRVGPPRGVVSPSGPSGPSDVASES